MTYYKTNPTNKNKIIINVTNKMHALLAILIGIIIGYIVSKIVDHYQTTKKSEGFDIGANSYIGTTLDNEVNNPQYFG